MFTQSKKKPCCHCRLNSIVKLLLRTLLIQPKMKMTVAVVAMAMMMGNGDGNKTQDDDGKLNWLTKRPVGYSAARSPLCHLSSFSFFKWCGNTLLSWYGIEKNLVNLQKKRINFVFKSLFSTKTGCVLLFCFCRAVQFEVIFHFIIHYTHIHTYNLLDGRARRINQRMDGWMDEWMEEDESHRHHHLLLQHYHQYESLMFGNVIMDLN